MTEPPRLTDPAALARHRARARAMMADGETPFLFERAIDDVQERLAEVNRTFTRPVVIGPFADLWRRALPAAHCVEAGETLPLAAGGHDLAIHALALHWADDPVGQLVQSRLALVPDGLFIAVTFGGRTLAGLRAALAEAETGITGGLSPRVAPMGEIRDLGALLQRAGFALPVADSDVVEVSYPSLGALARDLRLMGETNALAHRHRRPAPRRLFARAGEIMRAGRADGRIIAEFEIITLTGWAPAGEQPKPLRPGSAAARLAEALGSEEQPLPERAQPDRGD